MYGRLLFRNGDEKARRVKPGLQILIAFTPAMIWSPKTYFAATGVTGGSLLPGIKREVGFLTTETILMRSKTGSVRRMRYRNPTKRPVYPAPKWRKWFETEGHWIFRCIYIFDRSHMGWPLRQSFAWPKHGTARICRMHYAHTRPDLVPDDQRRPI